MSTLVGHTESVRVQQARWPTGERAASTLTGMTMTDSPLGAHLIGGEWITAGPTATSANPARPDEPVGEHPVGDASTASDAVTAAVDAKRT